MTRRIALLLALAAVLGGAQRLMAEEELERACCKTKSGAECCGETCSAGWFRCSASG
jgi:hypothetical protein